MGHDLFRGKQPFFDQRQQFTQPGMDVGLAHLERQPLIKGIAKQETMNKPSVHAGYANHATASNGSNALPQRFAAAAFNFKIAEDRFRGAAFRFEPNRINHGVNAALASGLLDDFFRRVVIIIKVDGDCAVTRLGKSQTVRVVIDNKDLLSA